MLEQKCKQKQSHSDQILIIKKISYINTLRWS